MLRQPLFLTWRTDGAMSECLNACQEIVQQLLNVVFIGEKNKSPIILTTLFV